MAAGDETVSAPVKSNVSSEPKDGQKDEPMDTATAPAAQAEQVPETQDGELAEALQNRIRNLINHNSIK